MQRAIESNKKGDTYEAFNHALQSYQYDNSNEEAKRFIKENLAAAFSQAIDALKKAKLIADELPSFREKINSLSKTQNYLKDAKFIHVNIVDLNDIKDKYEANLSESLIKEIVAALKQDDSEMAKKLIESYKGLALPKTAQIILAVNRLQQLFLEQGAYSVVIDFTKNHKDDISSETFKKIYAGLLKYAASDEAANKKRALETYLFLSDLDKNDAFVAQKISTLRNELLTMFAILELENNTDEFIPVNNNDFINSVKAVIDSKENLTEVILKDDGLNDIKDRSLNYDFFKNKNDLNVGFENNIRYLVVPKIATIRINRQSPVMVTKNASWNFRSAGDAIAAAFAEVDAYGRYKVQYYQYDEYSEKVNARMVIDVIVYDVKQKRVALKERMESFKEDAATWAENPMAVGIVNKIPATVYPPEIQALRNQKRTLMTDNELKTKLIEEISAEIGNKAKSLLPTSDKRL